MANEDVNEDTQNLETDEQELEPADDNNEELDAVALKTKLDETTQANRQLFERAKKAEGFVKLDGKWVKAPKAEPEAKPKVETKPASETNTSELDETALDFLDLKGFTEDEDITLIENIVAKTGQTVRQVLKDEYVVSKLETNKVAREAKKGTPEGIKRGGAQGDTFDTDMAKYESTGEYPDDFERRSKVVNKLEEKDSSKVPGYRKKSSFTTFKNI